MITIKKVTQEQIPVLSNLATRIVKEHFDPIIGKAQNDYMISLYQSIAGIQKQFEEGYQYFFILENNQEAGFFALVPKEDYMYLSKFYVEKSYRGHHLATEMMKKVEEETLKQGYTRIQLNCNKENNTTIQIYNHLGFQLLRYECNDIGNGFYMDDVVLIKDLKTQE